jgi:hypothetical protein
LVQRVGCNKAEREIYIERERVPRHGMESGKKKAAAGVAALVIAMVVLQLVPAPPMAMAARSLQAHPEGLGEMVIGGALRSAKLAMERSAWMPAPVLLEEARASCC